MPPRLFYSESHLFVVVRDIIPNTIRIWVVDILQNVEYESPKIEIDFL